MIVAGIGCRRGVPAESIERLLVEALAAFGLEPASLDAFATEASKGGEPGIVELARRHGLRLGLCETSDIVHVADRLVTRSSRVHEAKGVPSVAEGAALVIAGRNARLLGARVSNREATCAIAIGEGS